ncbi:MAG: S46 family peptidase [Gemmatimonadales bacterium]
MSRSARGWLTVLLLVSLGFPFGCSSTRAPEPVQPAVPEAAAAQVAEPVVLSGVEAVEAAGLGKMWTFDKPPVAYLEERYGFAATPEWLEDVRLSSLRTGGCTASFVSPNGLVMTNHHCARGCIAAVTPPGSDYTEEGFYATSRQGEPVCPGMYLDQLIEMEDVTQRVDAASSGAASEEEAARLRDEATTRIDNECEASTGFRCQVVSLYHGGIYSLYRYKRYTDVRLVFAPEDQAASFGGDPDNFTYPRHDLDVTFLRAYENGEPVQPEHYFEWSEAGAADGEVVFVTGNPGTTLRLSTVAQLEYMRDASYPRILERYQDQLSVRRELAAEDEARAVAYRNTMFYLENSIKAYTGFVAGLNDPDLMAAKRSWQRSFRAAVAADPQLQSQYGDAWDEIARINVELTELDPERRYATVEYYRLLTIAQDIVRLTADMARPAGAREYSEEDHEAMRRNINSPAPIDLLYEERLLALRLARARMVLGAEHSWVEAALRGLEPEAAARAIYAGSGLTDVRARQALVEGGAAAVQASRDPAIVFVRTVDARTRERERRIAELNAVESVGEESVADALFAVYGTALPPDATFTLRLQDGVVEGYPYNGTRAPYKTTLYGLYDRAEGFDYAPPWNLTARWLAAREVVDLMTPVNFVSTNDIVGGNSGSPLINADAQIVGLAFDGNIESLPGRFRYSDEVNRCVAVHSMFIIEALRRVYDAGALADEIQGVN